MRAPVEWKMIGIQAGASSRIQVVRPGAASNSRSPNWRSAWLKTDAGRVAGTVDTVRLCGGRGSRLLIAGLVALRFFHQVERSGDPLRVGAGGIERFVFEAAAAGTERVHFEYRRGQTGEPGRTYDLTVTVLP